MTLQGILGLSEPFQVSNGSVFGKPEIAERMTNQGCRCLQFRLNDLTVTSLKKGLSVS